MAILNKRISSATLPQLQKDARLGSIIRDVGSAPATQNEMFRTINPSASTNETPSPAYVSQLTSALREMQNSPQGMTSRIAPTQSNNVSLMSSQMPDMSNAPNISKGPITSITSSGDSARQKIGSTTSTSGGVSSALINALAGAVLGAGASKLINGKTTTTPAANNPAAKQPVTSTVSKLPAWAQNNPTITANKDGTYTQKMPDGSTAVLDKDGNIISTTDAPIDDTTVPPDLLPPVAPPPAPIDDTPVGEFKRGGLAVMMKDGGVPHFGGGGAAWAQNDPTIKDNGDDTYTKTMSDGSTMLLDKNQNPISATNAPTDPTTDPTQSILDLLKTTGGAAGAGGILAALLGSTGGSTNTQNTGLDMDTYGRLLPRTTGFGVGPAKYVSHKDYSPQSTYTPNAELLHNLSAPASNPVNEGDYTPNYVTNRPGTTNNQGTDINAIIAQIVNALQNKHLVENVNQASTTGGTSGIQGGGTSGVQGGGSNVTTGTKPPTTPSSTTSTKPFDTAELKASYDRLGKSGGTQNDLYSWVNAQIGAGASAADLAKATGYNVADVQKVIDTARAASHGTAPTGSGVAGIQSGSSGFQRDYGLKSQGYSRDYTPSQLATIEQTYQQYRNDPVKLAAMMKEYGVTTKDLALAQNGVGGRDSGDTSSLNALFISAGISPTDPIFAGNGPATDEQRQFIAWKGGQTDQFGRKISDTWAARGITDPYNDPSLLSEAQHQIIVADDRESLGVPSSATRLWSSTAVPTGTTSTSTPKPSVTDLQASYNTLGKSGGTNKDLYDWVNQQTAKGVSAADLAKVSGYNIADVQKVIDSAKQFNPLETSYSALNKAGGTNKDLYDWVNKQTAAGYKPADLALVSGYNVNDINNVVSSANRFAPLEQSYNTLASTVKPGDNASLYNWVNKQVAAGYNAHDLALASGYNEADVQNVINSAFDSTNNKGRYPIDDLNFNYLSNVTPVAKLPFDDYDYSYLNNATPVAKLPFDTSTIDNQPNGPEPGPTGGGLNEMVSALQASTPMNSGSTDGIPSAGSLTPPPEPTPFVRYGKTPEEEAADAQAAAYAQFYQNDPYGGNGGGGEKRGGAIHKATGGLTHYTFGKPADVMENLGLRQQQMARGGLPHVSNVPVVQGRMDFRQGSAVHGEGDGQSDDIPAMLADGEYVIDAETVAQIGNGSTKAGAQALDKFRESIRAHKRSAPINKIPPKTKALTSYLKVK